MSNGPHTPDPPAGGHRPTGNGQPDPQPWPQRPDYRQPGYVQPGYAQPGPPDGSATDPFQEIYAPHSPGPYDAPESSPYAAPGFGQVSPYRDRPAANSAPLPEHPQSVLVLVLGLSSLFTGITAPIACAIGSGARREVAAGRYAESPALTVGWILGIVVSLLMIIAVVLGVLAILAVVMIGA